MVNKWKKKIITGDVMEIIQISSVKDFTESKIVKKVPILTEQLMATILLIPPNSKAPAHAHSETDEIHYIIKGNGSITVGKNSKNVNEGMLILVPKTESHYFSTSDMNMIILSQSPVCEPERPLRIKDENLK
jgi:mannose-6-phosphate isomerase-like protein (cupin superfamily)